MTWTIRRRLVGLGALGAMLILLTGLAGWLGVVANSRASRDTERVVRATRSHLETDLMHDALYADVLGCTRATSMMEREAALTALREHVGRYRRHVEELEALQLSPVPQRALAEVRPALDRYVAEAEDVATLVERGDHDAAALRAHPLAMGYRQLEPRTEAVSNALAGEAARVHKRAEALGRAALAFVLIVTLFAALALLLTARAIVAGIVRPLEQAVQVMDAIAQGDLDTRLTHQADDELGRMSQSINRAVESLSLTLAGITRNAYTVGSASEELATVSQQMFANANETSTQTSVVSSAAEQVNANVRLVATSAQQVGASIREVAQNAQEAAQVARTAVRVADQAEATVQKLGASSGQIESVIKVISSIAEQTNILALNAEIEAARAGEAGRGFAVVANEVKDLAKETARATETIGQRIDAIQADSREAVATIAEIVAIINRISLTQGAIASAVEEQSAATAEITRNMGEAARGTAEIANTIGAVARATGGTSSGARETQKAANELAMMATELQRLVNRFRYQGHASRHDRTEVTPIPQVPPTRRAA
ncbi:MAG: methyl-accepting chemotaxis protein [Candidatus Eisenbacteria bacterium]